jgi:uncharacterized protein YaaN involved in tellurite resistance
MSSLFAKAGVQINGVPFGQVEVFAGATGVGKSTVFPATIRQDALPARQLIVSDDDIDRIGENVSRDLGNTTQKIITKMSVGKFDELGSILTVIASEADKLDPASLQKGGMVGWIQNKFGDLKATLTMRLVSAQQVFGDLENKISTNITTQQQWITDMEGLYGENYKHYGKIVAEMREVQRLIDTCDSQVAAWPTIDLDSPTAAMEAQMVRDAESKIHRLKLKLDSLLRLKTMTEINSPRIRQQQESSRTAVSTLKGIMMNIPVIMMEFALFKQTLDVNSSIQLVSNVRDLTEKSLLKGSEGAKIAAISSAKALGTATISTETLSTLRQRVLETVTEVRQIERDDVVRCTTDAKQLADGQKSLLTALQQSGSI